MVLDGVRIVFQFTPDAEAPAEMMFHFPHLAGAVRRRELHERDAQPVHAAGRAGARRARRGASTSTRRCTCSATTPTSCSPATTGRASVPTRCAHYLRTQRDTYRYLHDQTMRLANRGLVMTEIAEELDLPPSLAREFGNRGYYGTVNHNAKAVYQRYLGWFDGNPANLHPLPPAPAGGALRRVHGRRRRGARAGSGRLRGRRVPMGRPGDEPRRVRRPREHRSPRAAGRRRSNSSGSRPSRGRGATST